MIDTIRIVAWILKNTNEIKVNNRISHDYPIMWIQKYTMSQPLPQKWMVLSGVNLKQEFVGWLSKVGTNFTGLVHSLHRVGTNGILWSMLARADNMTIILDRVRLTSLVINTVRESVITTITKIIVNYKTSVRGWELNEESMFDW